MSNEAKLREQVENLPTYYGAGNIAYVTKRTVLDLLAASPAQQPVPEGEVFDKKQEERKLAALFGKTLPCGCVVNREAPDYCPEHAQPAASPAEAEKRTRLEKALEGVSPYIGYWKNAVCEQCYAEDVAAVPAEAEPTWNTCEHEWREIDSASYRDVICLKCKCPGEKDETVKGGVFWPAT